MLKTASVLVVAVLGILLAPVFSVGETTIEVGKPFEGDLRGKTVQLSTEIKFETWKVPGISYKTVMEGRDFPLPRPGADGPSAIDRRDRGPSKGSAIRGFVSPISVRLKAGQGVVISCKVLGDGRKVQLFVRNPDGIVFACTKFEANASQLKIGGIAATGVYDVLVFSDQNGRYTLRATVDGPEEESPDETKIQMRIDELKRELAEQEAKLAKIKESKVNKP